MRLCKLLLPLLASTLCFAAQQDRITGTIDSSQRVTLGKTLHHKAQPQYDLGAVDPSLKLGYITLLMAPSPSQQKELDQLLADQQDRSSPLYHQWLTPQQFADRFGLTPNDLNKVTGWLKSEGFQILSVGGGHNSIIFSGSAAQVQHAFGTEIHKYNVEGEAHIANSTLVMIPNALSGIVRSVAGLHDFRPKPAYRSRLASGSRIGHPDYYDGHYVFPNFLAPGDIATIYNANLLYTGSPVVDGSGQTLAIAGQTDIFLDDINDFRSGFALPTIPFSTTPTTGECTINASGIVITPCNTTNFQYVLVGTDAGAVSSYDIGEADLDIEWSGAVARNAQIIFINAQTTYGVFDALIAAIGPAAGPPLATVVSASYGEGCEAQATLDLETVFQQGNAEGVTILNSSGDVGAATCDFNPPNASQPFNPAVGGLGVSYPASSPEVTAVGGTEITVADDANPPNPLLWGTTIGANGGTAVAYIPEIAWNDDVELAQYCHAPAPNDTFCSSGGGTRGWVPLTTSATASQVQEDIWISMSGGGASNCWYENGATCLGPGAGPTTGGGFAKPSYQQMLSVPSAPAGVRYVPDVSLLASPEFPGYVFCTPLNPPVDGSTCASGIFTAVDMYLSLVGGTSVSSPALAGMVALLNQYLVAEGLQSSPGLGNINPMLYTLAATPSNNAFHNVTSGNNNVYCKASTPAGQPSNVQCPAAGVMGYSASNFDATTHYNLVTGLGSVNADALFLAWKGVLTAPDFTLAAGTLTPGSVTAGQSATATLTISPVNGSTQTITFTPSSCTGLPAGATCSFDNGSVTLDGTNSQTVTLTVATAPNMAASGAQTITVTGTPSGSGGTSHTTTVSLTVTATTETFSLASTNGVTFPVTVGGNASVAITVSGTNGFIVGSGAGATTALPLTYSCTGSPSLATAEISCTISPGSGQPTNATAVTVSLQTTAPTAQLHPPLGGSRFFYALLLPGFFGIVFAGGSRKRGMRLLTLIMVLGFCTLWLGACGGNSTNTNPTNPGTPKGPYTVTIGATTGGASPVTNSNAPFTIQLVVN